MFVPSVVFNQFTFKLNFFKKLTRVTNSLDTGQEICLTGPELCSKAVVLLLLTFCLLLLPLLESVIVLCFVVRCFVSILVLQSS